MKYHGVCPVSKTNVSSGANIADTQGASEACNFWKKFLDLIPATCYFANLHKTVDAWQVSLSSSWARQGRRTSARLWCKYLLAGHWAQHVSSGQHRIWPSHLSTSESPCSNNGWMPDFYVIMGSHFSLVAKQVHLKALSFYYSRANWSWHHQ